MKDRRLNLLFAGLLLTPLAACAVFQPPYEALHGGPRIGDAAWMSLHSPTAAGATQVDDVNDQNYLPSNCRGDITGSVAINACVDAMVLLIDIRWYHFAANLVAFTNGSNFALDAAGLGLNAAGAITGASTTHILSAIAGGLSGTKTALNNDVLLQKSVVLVVHQMATDRATAYKVILNRENGTKPYGTMQEAAIDLYALALASTWENALSNLETCTGSQAQAGQKSVVKAKNNIAAGDAADNTADTPTDSCGATATTSAKAPAADANAPAPKDQKASPPLTKPTKN